MRQTQYLLCLTTILLWACDATSPRPDDGTSPRRDSGAMPVQDSGPPPALCDGSDEIRLGFSASGGFVSQDDRFLSPFAYWYLVIRGDCSYVVSQGPSGEVRSGELGAARAMQLADELGFVHVRDWSRFEDSESCPDAGDVSLHALGARVSCTCGCGSTAPDGLEQAFTAAGDAMTELWASAEPITGPVTAVAYTPPKDISQWPSTLTPQEWTLPWAIERILAPDQNTLLGAGQRIEESDGAPALRDLRTHAANLGQFVQSFPVRTGDDVIHALLVRDELPEAWSELPDLLR